MTNIGVTGHRVLYDLNRLIRQVDNVLEKIQARFAGPFRLYSSLADGADRLVVQRAFEVIETRLVVPLPLKKEEYLTDFSKDSRLEFLDLLTRADRVIELPVSSTRVAAYEFAGRYMLDQVDVLVALWDGQPPRGQGGTGQIVLEARQRGLPIAWVYAPNYQPSVVEASASAPIQASVTYENFPAEKPRRQNSEKVTL